MRSRRERLQRLATAVSVALLVAGCASTGSPGTSASASSPATPTAGSTNAGSTNAGSSDAATASDAGSAPTADSTCPTTVTSSGSLDQAMLAGIASEVSDATERYSVPGALVRVVIPGHGDALVTCGVADIATGEAIDEAMTWPTRSMAKAFTVTVVLQLVDEGKLSLDDTIDAWSPSLPNADRVTVRQLADMTSGLPEYTTEAWIADYLADPARTFTAEELVAYAAAEPAEFEPGTQHVYTNTNTVVLGIIAEQITGQYLAAAMKERILGPLALRGTAYMQRETIWPPPHPTGYQPDDGQLEPQPNNFSVFAGAGAMTTTAADMAVWAPALADGTLLSADMQAQRLIGAPLAEGPEYDLYAFGIGELDGWWGHTGEGFGFTVLAMSKPGTGASVTIFMNLSNVGEHVPTTLFRQLAPLLSA